VFYTLSIYYLTWVLKVIWNVLNYHYTLVFPGVVDYIGPE